jgi:hypothetical protein
LLAFSADAAGTNVLGVRRWQSYRCGVIAGNEVLDFGILARLRKPRNLAESSGRGPPVRGE